MARRDRHPQVTAAQAQEVDDSRAAALVQRLLAVGIDGKGPFDGAVAVASRARAGHPSTESAVHEVVRRHTRLVAASGFATGVGGLVTLPVALPANVAGFYVLATRAVAAVAELRGYDTSRPEVRSAVLLTLVGADATDVLKSAGLPRLDIGGRLASLATRRWSPAVLMLLNKGVGFRLLARVGTGGLVRAGSRAVPVLGGAVGAGADALMLRRIAKHAEHALPPVAGGGVDGDPDRS
ncbi:EcsC family protein [Paenibacillus sp. TRM 82003]|uniref:EcsC family protein n=1 Tax=Kineococcus sp. TRM81007 TaxID=2925831 RepID=UPI001F55F037|nr:EcsC family protein [Kineococcus sp. TRM81007]MCI2240368.1 EcsC family protein [Kineococcus sp. TRM81007]MCI3927456.1 EcsC family protein [Paenibacillus sp. TRM 82003]